VRAAPGDPVEIMFGPQADGGASLEAVTKEQRDARRRELGIDRPLPEQYVPAGCGASYRATWGRPSSPAARW
jgi:ABC-type dipeptide/oligopeptide/nickel transport system permease component